MMEGRLTYRSSCGDYGSAVHWNNDREEIYALRNKLGRYEDNEWVSIAEHGNPITQGKYEVTIKQESTGNRWTDSDLYNPCNLYGFSINQKEDLRVVAWRRLPEPYVGI